MNCGVTKVVVTPANKTEEIFAKTHFAKLGRVQRKQLQYGLKQLGYYSSSIDGLWGKGTNAGVNSFAKDRNLRSDFPHSVFDALASEVAFENMAVSEPVSEKKIGNKNKLVCELADPEAFDRIEKEAGYRIFYGQFARPNLRKLTLVGDVLMYGEKKVSSYREGKWSVVRKRDKLTVHARPRGGGRVLLSVTGPPPRGSAWRLGSGYNPVEPVWYDCG